MNKQYRLYWRDGKTEVVSGRGIADAFSNAGYGGSAINALEFFDTTADQNYTWVQRNRSWVN